MKSATGGMLARAENLAFDSKGKRHRPLSRDFEGIRVKETKPHALSNPEADNSREEQALRDGRMARITAELTPLEREVLRLQGKLRTRREVPKRVLAGDVVEHLREGYTLTSDLQDDNTVEMVISEWDDASDPMSRAEIATALGITVRQVSQIVTNANRKMDRAGRRE